ncbi:hypothetical protein QE152_g24695 [Popillia japonica]|uniref:Uncharacterized protein n=1 Tax=Popillia japonica TaxID=7064 RepID=A0AAW1K5B8_POPJA
MFAKTYSNVPDITQDYDTQEMETLPENLEKEGEKCGSGHFQHLEAISNSEAELHHTSNHYLQTTANTPKRTKTNSGTQKKESRAETQRSTSVDSLITYFKSKKSNKFDPTDLLFLAHASAVKTFSLKRQATTKKREKSANC